MFVSWPQSCGEMSAGAIWLSWCFCQCVRVRLRACFLDSSGGELVLGFASFSIHYPPCPGFNEWCFLTNFQSQGLVTTTQFFLNLFTYSVICFLLLHLFFGSTQHQEDRKSTSSVLIAAEVGSLCLLATAVPAWQYVCSLRSSVFCCGDSTLKPSSRGGRRLIRNISESYPHGLCWEFVSHCDNKGAIC